MSEATVPAASDGSHRGAVSGRGETAAKYLVAFVFAINVCFAFYMVTQFFADKPYGNGLHAAYTAIVLSATLLLGLSARQLWIGSARRGSILFFAAIAVSFVGNLITQVFA